MQTIKCYLAANDGDGAHLYKTKPEYNSMLDRWMPAGETISNLYGYLNADLLRDMNIEIPVLMEVPLEVLIVADYCE